METRSELFFRSLGERVAGWERGLYRAGAAGRARLGAMRAATARQTAIAVQRARIFRDQTSAAALRGLSVLGRNVAKAQTNLRTSVSTAALASSNAVGRVDRRIVTAASITGVMLVSVAAFALTSPVPDRDDRGQNRRAFDTRAAELATLALRNDSHFFCLEAPQVSAMEAFCEQALFGSPAQVSAALSYVTARLGLLADGTRYARRHEPEFEPALAALRRSLEHDRYGLLAHVLASRDGCTAEQCDAFALLRDTKQVRTNLQARVFEAHVARSAVAWQGGKAPVLADKGAGGAEVALRDRAVASDAQVASVGNVPEKKEAVAVRPAEELDTALHELETPIRVASLDLAGNIVNDAGAHKPELRQAVAAEKPVADQQIGGKNDVTAPQNDVVTPKKDVAVQKIEPGAQKEASLTPKVEQPREPAADAMPKADAQKASEAAKLAEPAKDAAIKKDAEPQKKEAALKESPKQAEQSFQLEDVPPKLGGSAPIVNYRSLGDGGAGLRQQAPKPEPKQEAKADAKQDGGKAEPKKEAKADPKARTASRELKFPTADSIPAIDIMRAEPGGEAPSRKPVNNRESAKQSAPKEPKESKEPKEPGNKAADAPREQAAKQPQRQPSAKQAEAAKDASKDAEGAPKEAESKPAKKGSKAAQERKRLQKEREAQAAAERERIEAAPRNPLSALFQ